MNMSYCRWQNTLNDLRDCAGDLEERMNAQPGDEDAPGPLSSDERSALLSVLELAAQMLQQVGLEAEDPDADVTAMARAL